MRVFIIYFLSLTIGILCLSGCGGKTCTVSSGFVALKDTTLACKCGDMKLRSFDTLYYTSKGQCNIAKFHTRKLSEWLDDNEVIRVGMEPDAPPTYFTKGERETGFDYELLKQIFPKVFPGIKMEVKGYPYDTLHQLLTQPNPQIEIIAGGYVADTNLAHVIWTKPYLTYGYALITREQDKDLYPDLNALKGKKVGVYDDGITEDWLKTHCPEVASIIKGVDNTETPVSDWMKMLIDGKVDAIIYDYPFAVQELEDYDDVLVIANKRLNAPDDLKGYSFGIPAGNKRILKQINEAIDEFKKTPQFAQLVAEFIPDPDLGTAIVKTDIQEIPASAPSVSSASEDAPKTTPNPKERSKPSKKTEAVNDAPSEAAMVEKEPQSKPSSSNAQLYTVESGETLSAIAEKLWGDMDRWEDIYALNPHVVSPDIVYTGTVLKIPQKLSPKKKSPAKQDNKQQDEDSLPSQDEPEGNTP